MLGTSPVYVRIVRGVHSSATLIGIFPEDSVIRRQLLSKIPQLFGLGATRAGCRRGARNNGTQTAEDYDEECLGIGRPTKAAFPFLNGHALAEAGHEVQIFLLGEAVSLMRLSVAKAVVPVGWAPLEETLQKVVAKKIQIYACGACSRAR